MGNKTNTKKLESGRAEFAYECVLAARGKKEKAFAKDYKSYVKKISPLIQTNGLGNTLAFIVSKRKHNNPQEKDNAYDLIYEQLSKWLRSGDSACALLPNGEDLLKFAIRQPSPIYRQITTETLAFMTWLKRLADGLIEGEADGE
jgi:CRISPR-associated protein Cmr5